MFTEDKVTEIFCMADDFCKFFDSMMAKYTIPTPWERVGVRFFIPSIRCIHMFRDAVVCEPYTDRITQLIIVYPRDAFVGVVRKRTFAIVIMKSIHNLHSISLYILLANFTETGEWHP